MAWPQPGIFAGKVAFCWIPENTGWHYWGPWNSLYSNRRIFVWPGCKILFKKFLLRRSLYSIVVCDCFLLEFAEFVDAWRTWLCAKVKFAVINFNIPRAKVHIVQLRLCFLQNKLHIFFGPLILTKPQNWNPCRSEGVYGNNNQERAHRQNCRSYAGKKGYSQAYRPVFSWWNHCRTR